MVVPEVVVAVKVALVAAVAAWAIRALPVQVVVVVVVVWGPALCCCCQTCGYTDRGTGL